MRPPPLPWWSSHEFAGGKHGGFVSRSPFAWQTNITTECTMESSTVDQLRLQLEALKKFERLNAPSIFSYLGYLGELFLGAIILGLLVIAKGVAEITIAGIPHAASWILFMLSAVLISHALYLIFRYHSDKRVRRILEKVLSGAGKVSDSEAR